MDKPLTYQSIGQHPHNMSSVLTHDSDGDDESFDDSFSYEHFPVVCPTCQGSGHIDDEAGTGMIHFVPVKDERLRPAWMKVKIATLVLVILIVGGTTTFFLFPRTVSLNIRLEDVRNFYFHRTEPWIEYSFAISIVNENYFPVRLKEGKLELLYQRIIITTQETKQEISVKSRSDDKHVILLNATYNGASAGKYINEQCYCNRDYVGQLIMLSAKLSYWLHDQTVQSSNNYFYIDCNNMVFPLPSKDKYPCKHEANNKNTTSTFKHVAHSVTL